MSRIKIIFLTIAVLLVSGVCCAEITKDEVLNHFVAAGMAYQDEDYESSIEKYKVIIEGGRESGAVYFNLGNSYFRLGDVGRAVLNYERAKRLIPRDSDLNFNRRYVEGAIDQYSSPVAEGALAGLINSFVDYYTIDEMILICTVSVFLLGFGLLLALYMNWPISWRRWPAIVFLMIFIVFAAGALTRAEKGKDQAVMMTKAEAYFEPRDDSTVHFKLPEGSVIRILRSEGFWIKIERLDGKVGWVLKDELERI